MVNIFGGFAINQIRLKIVKAEGGIFYLGSMKGGSL